MKITIVGSGFVGQASGKGLTRHNHQVTFLDVIPETVAELQAKGFTAYLPQDYKKLTTDITMFCVPTPTQGDKIQLQHLVTAVSQFAKRLKGHKDYHVAVVRSTVPPTTTRKILLPIIENISGKKVGQDFGLVMQPEYLREASAEQDFARPWFILIGEYDKRSGNILEKIYRKFDAPLQRVSLEEAEFQKYVHNVYNAFKIAFFNEMRIIANKEGWDASVVFHATAESCEGIWNPIYGMRDFGPFDGSCLPKDSRALLQWGDDHGYSLEILRSVISENIRHENLLGQNETVRVNYLEKISV
ncbi:UDP-glucose/GDP-mannose dehydrogenase family protein [Candidatus Saccharibacteria bacterium]|nr:UDP-glucose/GDP-mannose dehydrogenase family protein [Candidatus Saccharibacteria bacterium]